MNHTHAWEIEYSRGHGIWHQEIAYEMKRKVCRGCGHWHVIFLRNLKVYDDCPLHGGMKAKWKRILGAIEVWTSFGAKLRTVHRSSLKGAYTKTTTAPMQ